MAYKNGDRVAYVPGSVYEDDTQWGKGPLLGTVTDARVDNSYTPTIGGVAWDTDVYPDHARRRDMPLKYLALHARSKDAVRGVENLTPGQYEVYYGGKVEQRFLLPEGFEVQTQVVLYDSEVKTVRAYGLDGRARTIYLGDAGVHPRGTRKTTKTCDLGHKHAVDGEPYYSEHRYTVRVDTAGAV